MDGWISSVFSKRMSNGNEQLTRTFPIVFTIHFGLKNLVNLHVLGFSVTRYGISTTTIRQFDEHSRRNKGHPTFRAIRQSCSAYSLSLKYLSSLNPYAVLFMYVVSARIWRRLTLYLDVANVHYLPGNISASGTEKTFYLQNN